MPRATPTPVTTAAKAVFDQSGEGIELATKWHIRAETMAHIYDHLDLQEPKL